MGLRACNAPVVYRSSKPEASCLTDQQRKPLFSTTPLIEFTFKKFLCVWVVFPLLFFLFHCCRHVSRLGDRGPAAPTQTHFPARARCHPASTAVEARDVPVRHLINSLIAAGQKEDPFLRIGEPGRQRYTPCLRGHLAQDKVCPSVLSLKRALVLRVW